MKPLETGTIKIVGIIDGDPFDKTTWSGSSVGFFTALKKLGCLKAGISGLPSQLINRLYQIKNWSPSLKSWKFKYHIDIAYYKAFTRKVRREIAKLDDDYTHSLQINSYYDVPSLIDAHQNVVKCAYQDGNLARLIDNPYGYPKISSKRIERAMQWEKKVFGELDYIFTFSEWLRQSFINDFNIPPNKIFSVGAGANIPIPEINEKREFDCATILFIGIDFERKGGKILIEAFHRVKKEIPAARLVIIGPTFNTLPDGAECLGYISKNTPEGLTRLKQAYMNASVFVMPSLYEPFGIVFLEAMAHGLPCIGTDNCAMPEIIKHGETGFLVPSGDYKSLAERIIELLKEPVLAKKMGDYGHKKVIENFTWDCVANRVVNILRSQM
jgi:glycosyltransferase involved in cell wall biosynthesis